MLTLTSGKQEIKRTVSPLFFDPLVVCNLEIPVILLTSKRTPVSAVNKSTKSPTVCFDNISTSINH